MEDHTAVVGKELQGSEESLSAISINAHKHTICRGVAHLQELYIDAHEDDFLPTSPFDSRP
jgi:hypothetical protein